MTRKHFEVVAQILAYISIEDIEKIEAILKTQNKNFNPKRFWAAVLEYQLKRQKEQ